tara:strand:- start:11091 stop:11234 length:144 start_codon:yes stop_codon:yes gene_type:complete
MKDNEPTMRDGARLFAIMLITELKKQGQHKSVEIVTETLKKLKKNES